MSAQEATTDLGNCFTVAYVGAITAAENGLTVRVVHGLPIGRGPTNRGERFWHAWVEIHANQWLVIDLSNGRDIRCTRAEYYRIGQIDPHRHLWRYTVGEVERQREADGGRLGLARRLVRRRVYAHTNRLTRSLLRAVGLSR